MAGNRGGTLPWEVETAETGGPTPGWTPDFQGPGDENSFANRFAAGNYFGAGSPSEHITSPYTDAGGRTHQPQIPGGFQTPYSFDNPGGALGRGGSSGAQAPIMGDSGWEPGESADTLTAGDHSAGSDSFLGCFVAVRTSRMPSRGTILFRATRGSTRLKSSSRLITPLGGADTTRRRSRTSSTRKASGIRQRK